MPRILIIENNQQYLKLITNCLKFSGYKCWYATTGKRGLELINEIHPSLIITELALPDSDGFKIIDKANGADTIVLTSVSNHRLCQVKDLCSDMGVSRIIQKPIDAEILLGIVKAIIKPAVHQSQFQPQLAVA